MELKKRNYIDGETQDPTYLGIQPTKNILTCDGENKVLCNRAEFCISLIDNGELLVNIWNLDGILLKFNNYGQRKTGYVEEEVLGKGWINKILPENHIPGLNEMFNVMKGGKIPPVTECKLYCKDGRDLDIMWSNYLMRDAKGNPYLAVSVGMDITELKNTTKRLTESYKELQTINNKLESAQQQLQDQLEQQNKIAYYDELTSLPNRSLLLQQLSSAITSAKLTDSKIALLFMDLDNFKDVNDTLGHNNGDELLKVIGGLFSKFASYNVAAARFGGDEFVLLIKNIEDKSVVVSLCNEVIEQFKKPVCVNNREFYISISIGAAIYPKDGQDEYTLLKNADIAMYNAKEQIGNRFILFDDKMNQRILEKLDIENGLRRALKNNEFIIFYQPQVNINYNKIVGLEALIRWNHPTQGLIPPFKFIPVAEETGLIVEIGEWVLRKVCEQFVIWENNRIAPKRMSVNISAKQFEQNEFIDIVEKIISETKMNPKCLELEITESIAMKNLDYTIKVINDLKRLNINTSLDDFGTGFSSLNYLMRLPINTLKIDKSFLDNIVLNSNEELIAKTIIKLAKKMKLDVVAEGVETPDQLNFLKKQKCNIAQGYLFSKPIPSKEVEDMLIAKRIFICRDDFTYI
ncbi:sensor domain-containing protein [Clostridium magnum]|uniref:Phytochrome-like protein cph2 n=1 Tax=Clostridium magnum DSM 2767 TaxID=1121326 RepID=A0A162RTZ8_9CLOT|nr:bifunctional diguanylate cyclase/phosphodiesterase [Clostridium magnum]KZL90374.1 phytochrome-like protein cph2 [Clostridium magnum DSM 2767]SHH83495.1 PAS domain S-box-containing protein/diguanylate cyclase (GGDEF) domain-containing protein [Clostridium magnum DSM 2767]